MKEVSRKLRIDVGTDYIDYNDNDAFKENDLLSALIAAYRWSEDLNAPVKIVWDVLLDNEEYKQIVVATIDVKKFNTKPINIKPKTKKTNNVENFFEGWSNVIKNL